MAALTERELGFNAGIEAAVDYHERICRAGEAAAAAALGMCGDDYQPAAANSLFKTALDHRMMGNDLRRLRKLTDEELEQQRCADEVMDR
jgi:hypothetical protein